MTQIQMKLKEDMQFYDVSGSLIVGYTLSINHIAEILHCTRAYVHRNVQPYIRFVKIPVKQDNAPVKNKSVFEKLEQEYIRNCFLAQEGVNTNDWKSTVWFNEYDFVDWFNSHFAAYRRTQPADINKIFPDRTNEAQKSLNDLAKYEADLANHVKEWEKTHSDLVELVNQYGTYDLAKYTVVINPKNVITDKTTKVPFVAIDRPIKSIREMDFKTVKDFDYPSKATRYFEANGAICYRNSGKALYMIPALTGEEKLLMSPSKIWKGGK